MRRILVPLFVLALGLPLPAGAEALHPKDLKFPSLVFEPSDPRKVVTKGGITLILMEDHELPLVEIAGKLRAGSYLDPAGKTGLAELTAAVARIGGAGARGGDQLDQDLEQVAAGVELSAGREAVEIHASGLSRNLDFLLDVLRDVLVSPRFEAAKLEQRRGEMLEAIRRENDEPSPIARREHNKVMYGPDSPWARTPTMESVKGLTRDDLVAFHKARYLADSLILGVAGDFDADALVAAVEARFAPMPRGTRPDLPGPETLKARGGVYLARKAVTQSTVRLGHFGLPRLHPDYAACQVMNRILGIGTFTSRMGVEIRVKRGLAYSVGSGIFEGGGPGLFVAVAQTKAESTHEVVEVAKKIIAGMGAGDVSDTELEDAKKTLLNQWVFEFDSQAKIVASRVEQDFYGYPADYLREYPKKIQAVTKEDVVKAARTHLRVDDLSTFVVGDPDKLGRPLAELGAVTEIKLGASR